MKNVLFDRPLPYGPHRSRVASLLNLGDAFRPFVGSPQSVTIASGWGHPLQTVHTAEGLEQAWKLGEPWRLAIASAIRGSISKKRRADLPTRLVSTPEWENVIDRVPLANEDNWNGVRNLAVDDANLERTGLEALLFAQRTFGSLLLATVTENQRLLDIVSPIESNLRDHALPMGLVGGRFFVYRTHVSVWN